MRLNGLSLSKQPLTTALKMGLTTLISFSLLGCNPSNDSDTQNDKAPATLTESIASEQDYLSSSDSSDKVIVYSYRPEHIIQPLLDTFTTDTGIATELKVYRGDSLVDKFIESPETVEADLVFLVDAMRFQILADAGLFRPLPQQALDSIPQGFKSNDDLWLGLGVRARSAVWKKSEFAPRGPADLKDLAVSAKLCFREGEHIYNRSFVGWLIENYSENFAKEWASVIFSNRQEINGGDRVQIAAVAEDKCDVAIVNHYYLAMLGQQDPELLNTLSFGWQSPNTPVQTNISGIAVTQQGENKNGADQLAVWLTQEQNAKRYASSVFELPLNWQEKPEYIAPQLVEFSQLKSSSTFPANFAEQWQSAGQILENTLNNLDISSTP